MSVLDPKPLDPNYVPLSGTNLVEASAGTGKTYAIAALYVRSLLETEAQVENILVVTYTRAATAELRDRIRKRIAETKQALGTRNSSDSTLQALVDKRVANDDIERDCKRLALALRSIDQASIFTIHGFCQRALQEAAFESGTSFDTEFENDDGALAREIADDFWAREMFATDLRVFDFYRNQKLTPETLRKLAREVIGNPDQIIVPDLPEQPDLHRGWQELDQRYAKLRSCWHTCREEIVELLLESPDLKRNLYKRETVSQKHAPTLDRLFAPKLASLPDEGHFLYKLTKEALEPGIGTKKGKAPPTHEFFSLASDFATSALALVKQLEGELLSVKLRLISFVHQENTSRKLEQATLGFDDLLLQLRNALRGSQGTNLARALLLRYPIALIDEFQDTDPVQYEIFQRIYGSAQPASLALFLIGDPKQAIYSFRGADLFTYFRARDDARGRSHTLATNHRSSPSMVEAVNTLFGRTTNSFLFSDLSFSSVQPSAKIENSLVDPQTGSAAMELLILQRKTEDGRDLTQRRKDGSPKAINGGTARRRCATATAGEILRLLHSEATVEGRPVVPGDIAVLVRTNKQARRMQEALSIARVPSVLESDSSVFLTLEAIELERVLWAIVHPGDRNAIRVALATGLFGFDGNALAVLPDDEKRWDEVLLMFRRWHELWVQRGFFQAFSQMMQDRSVAARLLSHPRGERKMTNITQLAELLQEHALRSTAGPQVLCAWLQLMRIDPKARSAAGEAAQLRLETDAASVKVVTVHKSKGLEYGIVFCPFLWVGPSKRRRSTKWVRFHDEEDESRLKLDIGSAKQEEHRQQTEREALAEDLRLLYVALTRARHRCSVVCGITETFGGSALAYLLLRTGSQDNDWQALKDFSANVERLEDSELETMLGANTSGEISIRPLLEYSGPQYRSAQATSTPLQSRMAHRRLARTWRTTSFSGLTRDAEVEHDHDAGKAIVPSEPEPISGPDIITMSDVPAGAHPGQMLHHVFEHIDFADVPSEAFADQLAESLRSHGFDPEKWSPILTLAYDQTLRSTLRRMDGRFPFCLADVRRGQRLDELEFSFPIRPEQGNFSASRLADALSDRESPPWDDHYLRSIRNLGFAPLSGFLKGFMDLVFVHEGRWYLMDYKSNMLGSHYHDYAPDALTKSMAEHHYFLQYHIYVLALHRHLQFRLQRYDYERDFGGVYYLFMRGMHPDAPWGNGVFFDRPTARDLQSLEQVFGTGEPT